MKNQNKETSRISPQKDWFECDECHKKKEDVICIDEKYLCEKCATKLEEQK